MPLTGVGAPLVSFPFVDLDHVLPSQGLMRQFVMVLVVRFRMSVAEIVMAYTLVNTQSNHTTTRNPRRAAGAPRLNTSLHAITRSSKCFGATQACYVATRSARSSWVWKLRSRVLGEKPNIGVSNQDASAAVPRDRRMVLVEIMGPAAPVHLEGYSAFLPLIRCS